MVDTELLKYQQLSNLGDINAILSLADFYLENKKYDKAFETLSRFNYLENKDGYRKLASLYERGIGVEADIEKAKELYKELTCPLLAASSKFLVAKTKSRFTPKPLE